MDYKEIRAWLVAHGMEVVDFHGLSRHLAGVADASAVIPGSDESPAPAVFIGTNPPEADYQVRALGDALHWRRRLEEGGAGDLHLVLAEHSKSDQVLDALGSLEAAYTGAARLRFHLLGDEGGFTARTVRRPDFSTSEEKWARMLSRRSNQLPRDVRLLSEEVNDHTFSWYRRLSGGFWSGRAEGLELCKISGRLLELSVGTDDDDGARPHFLAIMDRLGILAPYKIELVGQGIGEAIRALKELVRMRREGTLEEFEPEHIIEARVLRGAIPLERERGMGTLSPLTVARDMIPFQFPARWSPSGSKRHVDLLALEQNPGAGHDIPWVVELKRKKLSSRPVLPQEYRHAVTQVVLYREFLRNAKELHFWFDNQGLDPTAFRAAVAFPRVEGWRAKDNDGVLALARDFDVEIIELDC